MKLRVLSYNIHKCIGGLDRRYRPERIVETIAATARTGKIGDGKIFVLNVEAAVRVRTDERNDDAL